jgi:hypothetical protein
MKAVLEVGACGGGEFLDGAAGDLDGRALARVLAGLDGDQVRVEIAGAQFQRAARQGGGLGEVAALTVLDRHHLHQFRVARLQGQRGAPLAQPVLAAAEADQSVAQQIARVEVVRLGRGGARQKRFGLPEARAREVHVAQIEEGGEVAGLDLEGRLPKRRRLVVALFLRQPGGVLGERIGIALRSQKKRHGKENGFHRGSVTG